jgi:hypothetical protein
MSRDKWNIEDKSIYKIMRKGKIKGEKNPREVSVGKPWEMACGFQTKIHTINKYYNGPI